MLNFEDDKPKIILIVGVIILVSIYFFYPEDDYVPEEIKVVQPHIEKEYKSTPMDETPIKKVEKSVVKPTLKDDVEIESEPAEDIEEKAIEEKEVILTSTKDISGRYTISLVSDIEIVVKNRHMTRYVVLSGEIEEDSETKKFNMSLSQDYIDYMGNLKFVIKDVTDETRELTLDAYFLSSLDVNSTYNIKFDIYGESIDGYVISSQEIPAFVRKELEKNEPIVINVEEHNKGLTPPLK